MVEGFIVALSLAWLVVFLASLTRFLMKAQTPQEHDSAMRTLTGCIIGGIVIVMAFPVGSWIAQLKTVTLTYQGKPQTFYYTGDTITKSKYEDLDATEQARVLPPGTGQVLDTVRNFLMIVGGIVLVFGLIWGGISLREGGCRARRLPRSALPRLVAPCARPR